MKTFAELCLSALFICGVLASVADPALAAISEEARSGLLPMRGEEKLVRQGGAWQPQHLSAERVATILAGTQQSGAGPGAQGAKGAGHERHGVGGESEAGGCCENCAKQAKADGGQDRQQEPAASPKCAHAAAEEGSAACPHCDGGKDCEKCGGDKGSAACPHCESGKDCEKCGGDKGSAACPHCDGGKDCEKCCGK